MSGAPNQAARDAGRDLHWDTSSARTDVCDVVTATTAPGEVTLNFGATQISGEAEAEISVQLRRRLVLPPLTARNLRDMLRNLIADADARTAGGRQ